MRDGSSAEARYGADESSDSASHPRHLRERRRWDAPANGSELSELAWATADTRDALRDQRILIIDDCTLYRENLAAVLEMHGAAAPSVAWDSQSLVTALDESEPDIVLLNSTTHEGLSLVRAAKDISPNVRVIALGVSEDIESVIVECAEAGVAGYHMRTETLDDLLVMTRRVAAGESVCSPRVAAILAKRLSVLAAQRQPIQPKELVLTAREAQILAMLEMGMSNRDIAAQLCIAVHTVKNHLHSLLKKMGVRTRADAAAMSRTIRYADRDPGTRSGSIGN
ncbi:MULTISPECIES: response regulator transcription factor [unclassified Mycobacterium]|uniref:response regulator transcription factor n=1 Tax=unclassified Mycobacterium TaxID=2642494 RepID=UPI0029C75C72|nr:MULTISPECIES: response regulator transcription factor [unclassified Mycobacterium]